MDDKSSKLERVYTGIVCLGADLLLAKGSRLIFSRLQLRPLHQKQNASDKSQSTSSNSVAFLVDGENVSPTLVEHALVEAEKLGNLTIKRVYGSCSLFTSRWNDASLHLGLEQIHLARPTANKNTADIALAVNAIELAKDGVCNRFCIVSSDSDFTPLVRRLRDLNCQVLGIGERKTASTLTKACNWFVFADQLMGVASTPPPARTSPARNVPPSSRSSPLLQTPHTAMPAHSSIEPSNGHQSDQAAQQPVVTANTQAVERPMPSVATILTEAYRDAVHGREGEWVLLSRLGLSLRQLYPDFKATNYAGDLSD